MFRVVGGSAADLSDRERVVATKFAEGMTYRQIGESLFIAPTTVRSHLSAIYRKLGVHNKVALADLITAQRERDDSITPVPAVSNDDGGRPVVAVVPIENLSGDEFWTRLAEGLSADIIIDLARYSDLAVISRQTMTCYKGRREDVRSIGRELHADYVLEGTLQADGQGVRIAVQLIDSRTEVAFWTARYERSAENLFAMQDSITENIINCWQVAVGRSPTLVAWPPVGSILRICVPTTATFWVSRHVTSLPSLRTAKRSAFSRVPLNWTRG